MKNMQRWWMAPLALMVLAGCSKYYYNPAPQVLPANIRRIAIRPFANHTQQYGLEDKLTLAVQQEFLRDGRFGIATEEQADGVLIGDITRYILEPLSYDSNHVPTQYKLWMLVDITFYDKTKNLTLWKESNLSGELRYYVRSSNLPGAMEEEDARQVIRDQLARDVRTRTLEGFGSVTGKSQKAVPGRAPNEPNTVTPNSEAAPQPPSTSAPATPSAYPY